MIYVTALLLSELQNKHISQNIMN